MYLTRENARDFICIHDCNRDWALAKKFDIGASLRDADNAIWSPDGKSIFLFESLLTYKFVVYSPDGRCLASFTPFNAAEEMEEFYLGIKSAAWSPTSQFIAVGGYDHSLRLVNGYTWKTSLEWETPTRIDPTTMISVYREKLVTFESGGSGRSGGGKGKSFAASKPVKETHSVQCKFILDGNWIYWIFEWKLDLLEFQFDIFMI